jgi:hypothetical protein
MLRPGSTPASRGLLLAGAAIMLLFAGWLTYAGIGYAINGCACDEPFFPDWAGWVLVSFAAPVFVASALLAVRALRRKDTG